MAQIRSILPILSSRLATFRARRRGVRGAVVAAETLLIFVLALLGVVVVEGISRPAETGRMALSLAAYGGALIFGAWRIFASGFAKSSLRSEALSMEEAAQGRFRERLVTAVELAEESSGSPGINPWMVRRTLELAEEDAVSLDAAGLVDTRVAHRRVCQAAAAAGLTLVMVLLPGVGPRWRLALNPFAPAAALSQTRLLVHPGDVRLEPGTNLEVTATAQPRPETSFLEIRWDDGFQERLAMVPQGTSNRFATRLSALAQGCRYRVRAGDASSPSYRVLMSMPPRVERIQWEVAPPSYAGQAARQVDGGEVEALAGSRLKLRVQFGGEKVERCVLRATGQPDRVLTLRGTGGEMEIQAAASFRYGFGWHTEGGATGEVVPQWNVRVVPDQRPVVTWTGVGLEAGLLGRDEVVLFQVDAQDDIGLEQLQLVSRLNGTNEMRWPIPWPREPAAREFHGVATLDLATRGAATGDEVQLQVEAVDGAGQVGVAGPITLAVAQPEVARLAALAQRLREQLMRVDANAEAWREVRARWLTLGRTREAEFDEVRRDLATLQSRLEQCRAEWSDIGDRIQSEATRAGVSVSAAIAVQGADVRAWGEAETHLLKGAIEAVLNAASADRAIAFSLGRDQFDEAATSAARVRRQLAIAMLALEAEVLATRCEAAQGRYKRALPLARVAHGWEASMRSGLKVDFLASLAKNVVFQTNMVPHLDNFEVPGHGRDNWTARFSGELLIPDTATWTLGVEADDGVRLQVDGKTVTPAEAWREHPATLYRTNLNLAAGWHPVLLEMYQAGGESKLRAYLGRQGKPLNEVPSPQWRSAALEMREVEKQVASMTPEALRQTDSRVHAALSVAAEVPAAIHAMTNEVALENLAKLLPEARNAGAFVQTNNGPMDRWTRGLSHDLELKGDVLVNLARDARNVLRGEMDQLRWKIRGPAPLRPVRVPMEALHRSVEDLRKIAQADKARAGKRAAQEREVAQAMAWAKELRRATQQLDDRFFERARAEGHPLVERAQDLLASSRMEREAAAVAARVPEALQNKASPEEMASQLQQQLDRMERVLSEAQRAVEVEQLASSGQKAREAEEQARAWLPARGDAAREATAYRALHESVEDVARAERMRGNPSGADALERAVSNASQNANPSELEAQLRAVRQALPAAPESLANLPAPGLREQAQALEKGDKDSERVARALAKPRLALALEAERARRSADPALGQAYQNLGRELGQMLKKPDQLAPRPLEAIADRAEALAGGRGAEARQKELAETSASRALENDARAAQAYAKRLDELSSEARGAADDQNKRGPMLPRLDQLAAEGDPSSRGNEMEARQDSARQVAAEAAGEAGAQVRSSPQDGARYRDAASTLAAAAEEIRMDQAAQETMQARPPSLAGSAPGQGSSGRAQSGQGQASRGQASAPGKPSPGAAGEPGALERPAGDASGLQAGGPGEDQAEWAKLSGRLRQSIRSSGWERFPEEQQQAIRAYYRRLGATP